MIDFRYHIVSIVAIFLALAAGIVLGTAALNGPLLTDLRGRVDGLAADKRALEAQVRDLQTRAVDDENFASAVAPTLVAGHLPDARVLVLSAPGAGEDVRDALVTLLQSGGATVTGRVRLRSELTDPAKAAAVDDLVARPAPPGVPLAGATPVERAAALLAAALVRPSGTGGPPGPDATASVLAGFRETGLLVVDGPDPAPAALVVVVAAPAPARPTDVDRAAVKSLLPVVAALDGRGGGTVVAGPIAANQDGGLIGALRGDPRLPATVSGVDDADTSAGRVATVLALAARRRGEIGQYGVGPGASAPLPPLVKASPQAAAPALAAGTAPASATSR